MVRTPGRGDPYEGKVKLGRMVLDAARAAVHDDSDVDLARVNAILTGEVFVAALADAGCMITRIPTEERGFDVAKAAAQTAVAASEKTGRPVDPRVNALAES